MNNEPFNRDDTWLYWLLSTLDLPGAPLKTHLQIAHWKYENNLTIGTRILPKHIMKLATSKQPDEEKSITITLPQTQALKNTTRTILYYQTELTPFQNIEKITILEQLTQWYKSLNYQIYNAQNGNINHTQKIINLDKNPTYSIPILIHHLAHIILNHPLNNPCKNNNEYIANSIEYYYREILKLPEIKHPLAPGTLHKQSMINSIVTQIRDGIYQIAQIIDGAIEPEFEYDTLNTPPHLYIEQTIGCNSWGYPPQILVGYLPGDCSYELSKHLKNHQIPYKAINLEGQAELRQKAKQAGYVISPVIYSLTGKPIAGLTTNRQKTKPQTAKQLFTQAWQKIMQTKP